MMLALYFDRRILLIFLTLVLLYPTVVMAKKNNGKNISTRIIHVKTIKLPKKNVNKSTTHTIAIQLSASYQPPLPLKLAKLPIFNNYPVYVTMVNQDRKRWYWTRMGFFKTKAQADAFIKKNRLKKYYPKVQAVATGREERRLSRKWSYHILPKLAKGLILKKPVNTKLAKRRAKAAVPIDSSQMAVVMENARKAIAKKEYRRAVLLYTAILQSRNVALHEQALELLGLARERNGQLAHAKAEYEKFLRRYPDSLATDRVRQRLLGIVTARDEPKKKLRLGRLSRGAKTEMFGSVSQYLRINSNLNKGDAGIDQTYVATDAQFHTRYRGRGMVLQSRISGSYQAATDTQSKDDNRLYYAYIDASSRRGSVSTRLGRQSRSTGGVLGRFDGGLFSLRMASKLKMNLVAGFPAYSSSDNEVQKDRFFQGISFDLGTLNKHWDISTYYVTQQVQGIIDRQAVGSEVRYFSPKQSYFTLVDYDISYETINTAFHLANWRISKKTGLNMVLDYRKSPTLTTSNALQGQTVQTLEQLLTTLSEDQIRQLALDRTPDYRSMILSATQTLNKKLELSGDFTITSISATPASGGVAATPDSGEEYFYGLRLVANQLFSKNDVSMIGVRYADTSTRKMWSLMMNNRIKIRSSWRINPKLRVNQQKRINTGEKILSIEPGLRLHYRWRKNVSFELDTGLEFSDEPIGFNGEDQKNYYVYAGYRWNF